jgi:hypothetical protein
MVRCSEGHFYDPGKHGSCPWCAKPLDVGPGGGDPAAGKTKPVGGQGAPEVAPPPAPPTGSIAPPPVAVPAGATPGVTKRVAPKELGIDPVVGWLVCSEGADRGRDFRIHTERNFIGRAPSQDICISGDDTISREKHAILSFDPKKKEFWVQPGESTGLVYLNGDAVYVPIRLKERDTIELGQTKLIFLPFVNESFQW